MIFALPERGRIKDEKKRACGFHPSAFILHPYCKAIAALSGGRKLKAIRPDTLHQCPLDDTEAHACIRLWPFGCDYVWKQRAVRGKQSVVVELRFHRDHAVRVAEHDSANQPRRIPVQPILLLQHDIAPLVVGKAKDLLIIVNHALYMSDLSRRLQPARSSVRASACIRWRFGDRLESRSHSW